jgi:hypothetical protein
VQQQLTTLLVVKDKYQNMDDSDDDGPMEEDEGAVLVTKPIEDQFLNIIPLIRKKDASIYDPKASFFPGMS